MKSKFYTIKCITNLHMGNGDINFNIIDNEVQRDPVTGYPSMYSSGIKGALREAFRGNDKEIDIFGSKQEDSNKDNKNGSKPGKLRFLTGNLLAMPIRSGDCSRSYYLVTTKTLLQQTADLIGDITGNDAYIECIDGLEEDKTYSKIPNASVEQYTYNGITDIPEKMAAFIPEWIREDNFLIIPDKDFKEIKLPVLARNCLENGISKNLWYEEVVPYKSVFVFGVLSDGTSDGDQFLEVFDSMIKDNSLIQFGGNATVGYGLTKVMPFEIGGAS